MLTPCNSPMFILKLSACRQVELSAAVIASLDKFKSLLSTCIISAYFSTFFISSLKFCCDASCLFPQECLAPHQFLYHQFFVVQSLTQLVKFFISFCCNIVLGNIQRFIILFSQSLHSNRRNYSGLIFLGLFCPRVLANQALGPSPLSKPVFHH